MPSPDPTHGAQVPRALSAEVEELLQRWSERTRDGGADRITYLYYAALLPYPALEARGDA